MTGWELVLHVAAVTVLVYGVTESRLARPLRWRIFRHSYQHDGADLTDESWTLLRDEPWRWDEFVKADDDPPFYAVLVTCHWCTGVYVSIAWTALWALWRDGWLHASLAGLGVVGAVILLAVIARLAR